MVVHNKFNQSYPVNTKNHNKNKIHHTSNNKHQTTSKAASQSLRQFGSLDGAERSSTQPDNPKT